MVVLPERMVHAVAVDTVVQEHPSQKAELPRRTLMKRIAI